MVCPSRLSALRAMDFDRSGVMTEEVVNCTTCNRCIASCPRQVPITKAIERIRRVMSTPGYSDMLSNMAVYGSSIVPHRHVDIETKSCKVAYFAGCLTNYRMPEIAEAVCGTLDYLGIEFTRIPEVCCGSPLNRIGRFDLAKKMLEQNLCVIRSLGVETVITSCPGCTSTLLEGQDEFEVLHYLELYDRYHLSDQLSRADGLATMQYPCHLYRNVSPYTMLIAEKFLSTVYRYERLPEADRCCGAGGGVRRNDVRLSRALKARKVADIKELAPDVTVTACPQCKVHLSEDVPGIDDLAVLIAKNLGILPSPIA